MQNDDSPIKARMFVGGLKSLFIDMAETLEQVEKTGKMPVDILESLLDVKSAIDMTLLELNKTKPPCCEHQGNCYHEAEDSEEDCDYCDYCEESLDDCECEFCKECGKESTQECECKEEEEEEEVPTTRKVKKPETKVINLPKNKHRN